MRRCPAQWRRPEPAISTPTLSIRSFASQTNAYPSILDQGKRYEPECFNYLLDLTQIPPRKRGLPATEQRTMQNTPEAEASGVLKIPCGPPPERRSGDRLRRLESPWPAGPSGPCRKRKKRVGSLPGNGGLRQRFPCSARKDLCRRFQAR